MEYNRIVYVLVKLSCLLLINSCTSILGNNQNSIININKYLLRYNKFDLYEYTKLYTQESPTGKLCTVSYYDEEWHLYIEVLEYKEVTDCSFPLKIDPFLSAKLTHPNIIIYL